MHQRPIQCNQRQRHRSILRRTSHNQRGLGRLRRSKSCLHCLQNVERFQAGTCTGIRHVHVRSAVFHRLCRGWSLTERADLKNVFGPKNPIFWFSLTLFIIYQSKVDATQRFSFTFNPNVLIFRLNVLATPPSSNNWLWVTCTPRANTESTKCWKTCPSLHAPSVVRPKRPWIRRNAVKFGNFSGCNRILRCSDF